MKRLGLAALILLCTQTVQASDHNHAGADRADRQDQNQPFKVFLADQYSRPGNDYYLIFPDGKRADPDQDGIVTVPGEWRDVTISVRRARDGRQVATHKLRTRSDRMTRVSTTPGSDTSDAQADEQTDEQADESRQDTQDRQDRRDGMTSIQREIREILADSHRNLKCRYPEDLMDWEFSLGTGFNADGSPEYPNPDPAAHRDSGN